MERTSVLAHRGIFYSKEEKNTKKAISYALNEGFGLETDLRDHDGKIVISHDPPKDDKRMISLDWLLEQIHTSSGHGRIALNIKADGLASMIGANIHIKEIDCTRIFVFDMSIPDSFSYFDAEIPVYTRISDVEENPTFQNKVAGIWIDDFSGTYPQVEKAKEFLGQGFKTTLVSPELHGRNHKTIWEKILVSKIYKNPLFELCTDFPIDAAHLFCNN